MIVVVTIAVIYLGLGRGLRPLNALALKVQELKVDSRGLRLETEGLPQELQPIGDKLNQLLERVEASLARERRFSSHAAHELRTPLAVLKVMAELAGKWPDEATPRLAADMLGVISDLEELLSKLLLLSRSESTAHPVQLETIDLRASVERALKRERAAAEARSIDFLAKVEASPFHTDPVLWQAILGNLLGNAARHAPPDSVVQVEASPRSLLVSNAAPGLTPEDLAFIFERFWRKDTSRGAQNHSGLGLAIVQTAVELLGGVCRAELSGGNLRIVVSWNER
jgi:signal transduction histidine kinase